MPCPWTFYPWERDLVSWLQGWSGWVWKILPPPGTRFPDHPASSKWLFQLWYPDPSYHATETAIDISDVHVNVRHVKVLTIKPTRCTNFSNLFLEWNSTCFGQFLCPSSGVFHCTHSNGTSYRFADSLRAGSGWNSMEFHHCKLSADPYDMYHCRV